MADNATLLHLATNFGRARWEGGTGTQIVSLFIDVRSLGAYCCDLGVLKEKCYLSC